MVMKNRNRKQIIRVISFLLVSIMLLTAALPVFAVTITTDKEQLTGADIVSEDVSRREEFVKHYLTGDGTYFAVAYAEQVNYLDDDGKWKEVDNTFSTNIFTGEKSTRNDKFKVKFANKANKDKLVSIQTDEFKVSWGLSVSEDGSVYSELNKVKGVENEALKPNEGKTTTDVQSLGKAVSGIIYEDAFGDYLDVHYGVAHQKVKEDLILNEKSDFRSYRVTYNVNNIKGAYAVLSDNGEVTFYNGNDEALFKAGVPVMYDDAGESSADIQVDVVQGKKTIEITYTPSSEWLSDDERVYPVTIDPSVQSRTYTSNYTETAYCFSSIPYEIHPSASNPTVALYNDQYYYIRLENLPQIPDFAYVTGVDFVLRASYVSMPSEDFLKAERICSSWYPYSLIEPEGSVLPQTNDSIYTNNNYVYNLGSYYQINFSIPNDYLWRDGGYNGYFSDYYGFKISARVDGSTSITLYTGCSPNSAYRPTLVVRYSYTAASNITHEKLYRIKNIGTNSYLSYFSNGNSYYFNGTRSVSANQYFKVFYNAALNTYNIVPYTLLNPDITARYVGFEDDPETTPSGNQLMLTNYAYEWCITFDATTNQNKILSAHDPNYTIEMFYGADQDDIQPNIKAVNDNESKQTWVLEACETEYLLHENYTIYVNQNQTLYMNPIVRVSNWQSSNSNVASVDSHGVVTTISTGETEITAQVSDNVFKITVNVLLPDGEYFIKNRHENNRRYLQIDDNVDETPDGAFMELWAFSGEDDQIWEISHYENGYYHIVSKDSGLALMVAYNKQTIEDEKIVQGTYHYGNENQLWRITLTQYDSFKIANRATIEAGSNLVMCMGGTLVENSNGVNVRNRPYEDNESYRDEWFIETIPPYDEYEQLFIDQFGFSADVAEDLVRIYYGLKGNFPLEDDIQLAWHYSRLLGGLIYDKQFFYAGGIAWNDVAGELPVYGYGHDDYFLISGFSPEEYEALEDAIDTQHGNTSKLDFAHMQISFAARLAYTLNKSGFFSNFAPLIVSKVFEIDTDEDVSYLAGWLGDAVLPPHSMGNSDYMADLDAENVYQILLGGDRNIFEALIYYYDLITPQNTRANIFRFYVPYEMVKQKILIRLYNDYTPQNEDYYMNLLKTKAPDIYNFIYSIRDGLNERGNYV